MLVTLATVSVAISGPGQCDLSQVTLIVLGGMTRMCRMNSHLENNLNNNNKNKGKLSSICRPIIKELLLITKAA